MCHCKNSDSVFSLCSVRRAVVFLLWYRVWELHIRYICVRATNSNHAQSQSTDGPWSLCAFWTYLVIQYNKKCLFFYFFQKNFIFAIYSFLNRIKIRVALDTTSFNVLCILLDDFFAGCNVFHVHNILPCSQNLIVFTSFERWWQQRRYASTISILRLLCCPHRCYAVFYL